LNRRQFIRRASGILVPAGFNILVRKAQAQGVYYARPAAGASCSLTYSNDASVASSSFGAGNYYFGQAQWQRPAAITICRLGFELLGDGSSRNWFVGIFTMSGINMPNPPSGAQVAVSAAITGANWASPTWVEGDLVTPFAPLNATNYALLIYPETAMAGNNMASYLENTAFPGYREVFNATGAASFAGGNDASIRIYTQ
jgi:hypothetical protein